MGELNCFLSGNAEKRENKKIVVSERFKDKNGPVEWEVRSISASEDEELRRACTRRVPVVGRKNQYAQDFDANAYLTKLAARAVVFPDLNNAELQNSYGVIGAEQLIKSMLYKDEFDRLTELLVENSGVEDMDDKVDQAKN